MNRLSFPALLVFSVAVAVAPVAAQRPQDAASSTTLASYTRARGIVEAALQAHGGLRRIPAIEDMTIRYRGRRWMVYQSPKLARPWNVQRTEAELVLDLKNGRMMRHGISRYPVDFAFEGTTVLTPQGNFFYDPSRAGKGDVLTRFRGGPPVASHPSRRELPAFVLLNARDRAYTLRHLGEATVDGARTQTVAFVDTDGSAYTLYVDDATKRLVRTEIIRDDPVVGDQAVSLTYSDWRTEKGVIVPGRLVERRNEEIVREDTLTITLDTRPGDSVFAAPTGYTEVPDGQQPTGPETEAVRKLADNVYLLQQLPGGNRVMFVAFRDYVLVFEAPTPQAAATSALEAIRRTVPGKPVRYVTFSHHHDDHAGGLRPYIAEGITIVTTPSNRRFIEDVAVATHTLRRDSLSVVQRRPVIETYARKRVFTDGDMTVELHDIGPTSHVDEIVLAYLPRERLVFQGDLLILPSQGEVAPANTLTEEFARAIERLKLDVQTIAGVHGRVGTIEDLRKAVQLRAVSNVR